MSELRPSSYIMGIIIFTLFIVGGVTMLNIFRTEDSTFIDDTQYAEFNNTFNVYNDVNTQIGGLSQSITNSSTDFGTLGVLNGLIVTAWQSLKLMVTNWAFMSTVFMGLTTMFGVPAWIPGLIIMAVVVMFVFALYSAFFQREL